MTGKKGLGRGLDALFADNAVVQGESGDGRVLLRIMDIEPNRSQPRKQFDETALSELADSIAQHGVLQPLLVRPTAAGGYQLIAGERRWRAARMAGLTEIPVVIREMTDEEAAAIALIENLQREDLNPMEEALGYQSLMESCGITQEEAANRVGKSRPAVANALRLLKLPKEVADMVLKGVLSAGHAKALLGFKDEKKLIETAKLTVEKNLSVRDVERLVKNENKPPRPPEQRQHRAAIFDEIELALTQSLHRKVRVCTKAKQEKGTLEIDFYDKEDLSNIVKALNQMED
ncbi:MAG: ParB/RepB/Spo0J family partition protein [Clostridiales bacterium]|nr:ParB/RepB/Spo0J family partition protein [Clostridiales bacterium]